MKEIWKDCNVVLNTSNLNNTHSIYKTQKGEEIKVVNFGQLILNKETKELTINKNNGWSITADTDILIPQDLICISGEDIKKGDDALHISGEWGKVLEVNDKHITVSFPSGETVCQKYNLTKIVALWNGQTQELNLPQIHSNFFVQFVDEWNKGNKIEKVKVKYNEPETSDELEGKDWDEYWDIYKESGEDSLDLFDYSLNEGNVHLEKFIKIDLCNNFITIKIPKEEKEYTKT